MTLEPFAAVQAAAVASSERLAPERCCCAPSLITQAPASGPAGSQRQQSATRSGVSSAGRGPLGDFWRGQAPTPA